MKIKLIKNFIVFALCTVLFISVCFAEGESSTPSITVSEQQGSIFYRTDGEACFRISYANIQPSVYSVSVRWLGEEPEGVDWSFSEDCRQLTFTASDSASSAGDYGFCVVCGETVSNGTSFTVLSKMFPMPAADCVIEYDSEEHSIIDGNYSYDISGTVSASEVGEYSAVISLPDNVNCTWEDGTAEPVSVSWEITPRTVTVSGIKAVSKVCDGTDSVELSLEDAVYDGMIEGDSLSVIAEGVLDNPNVGGGKLVCLSLELTGEDAGNYVLSPDSQTETVGSVYRNTASGVVECVTDPSENFRNGSVTETDEEFLDIIMNPEMKTLVKNGANLKIWLSVSDITESVPEYDIYRVNSAIGDSTVAAYLDINIFRQFGNEEKAVKIPEIEDEITIEIDMPKSIINNNRDISRTYQLIRVHNGVAEPIDVEYDAKANVLRFNTDRFSTYALTFKDVDKPFSPAVVFADDGNYSVLWVIGFLLLCSKVFGCYLRSDAYDRRKKSAYQGRH